MIPNRSTHHVYKIVFFKFMITGEIWGKKWNHTDFQSKKILAIFYCQISSHLRISKTRCKHLHTALIVKHLAFFIGSNLVSAGLSKNTICNIGSNRKGNASDFNWLSLSQKNIYQGVLCALPWFFRDFYIIYCRSLKIIYNISFLCLFHLLTLWDSPTTCRSS